MQAWLCTRLIGIFSKNSLDLETLREFCKREGEAINYYKGDQLERECDPARWFAYVESGCFKYVNHGVSNDKAPTKRELSSSLDMAEREEAQPKDKEHITWFSFEGEFVVDYPTFLYGRPSQTTIVAMMPSRVIRVTGEQMKQYFSQSIETMELRALIAEHLLEQFRSRYLDLHCTTARERYNLLMQRCPGIVDHLDLQDIASFLNVHPNTISKIRRDITFYGRK
jgi:CRP-like cAMP-binding protein